MDTLMSIKVFRTVVELSSFVATAERLDLSTAMVSRHVMHIEQRIGVRLLNRNSRTLSLTEAGAVYFERCKILLDDLEATELELGALGTAPRGILRVTGPSWAAGGQRLADLLAAYRHSYPDVVLDMSFEDRVVDLVEEGYDLALRAARTPSSLSPGLIAQPLRPASFYLAASREYLERNGVPTSPQHLERHDFVAANSSSSVSFAGPKGPFEVPIRVVLRYRSVGGVANAIAAGLGIGAVPAMLFEDPVFRNVLIPVLHEHTLDEVTLYVVYVSRKHVPLKIRTFVDFVVQGVSRISLPRPPAASNS
jgi:DNA-binding transcriptional LysR family regulator